MPGRRRKPTQESHDRGPIRPGVTTAKDPEKLITCPSCDIILTRDRLKENKEGKPCCPKCGQDLDPLIRVLKKPGPKIIMPWHSCSSASGTPAGSRSSSR